jgi:hypothetical protein
VHPALDDPEDRLAGGALALVPGQAAVEPAVGALGGACRVLTIGVCRRALVEGQRDVRGQGGLDPHRLLRAEEAVRAVEQGLERDTLLGDLHLRAARHVAAPSLDLVRDPAVGEREDLEAARVGDDRPFPAHEAVQAAARRDPVLARR